MKTSVMHFLTCQIGDIIIFNNVNILWNVRNVCIHNCLVIQNIIFLFRDVCWWIEDNYFTKLSYDQIA